jgi:manganese/zinc/iron transport system permease protein
MSPYWGAHFFDFFAILVARIAQFALGQDLSMAADELQIATLGLAAISCGIVGPFLVLKKMAMFANSLSHTILLGIVSAYLFAASFWGGGMLDVSTLLLGAAIAAFLTAFFTEGFVRLFRLQEDASIGLVFTTLFALGILLVTLYTRNIHLGVEAVTGNVDALHPSDLRLTGLIALLNVVSIAFFYRQFQISSFDKNFGQTVGISCGFFHFFLLFLAATVCMSAFRSIGVLLVLAFLVGPYLTARLFSNRLPFLLFLSPLLGLGASLIGVALARHVLTAYDLPLSTGGIVVIVIGLFYIFSLCLKKLRLRLFRKIRRVHM